MDKEQKLISLTGIIKSEYDTSWNAIKLVQEDGFKIDLIGRIKEIIHSYPNYKFQISYYVSDAPATKNEIMENWLRVLSGDVTADYEANSYCYSSYTQGTDYDSIFNVGKHDLYTELLSHQEKFIYMEIKIQP